MKLSKRTIIIVSVILILIPLLARAIELPDPIDPDRTGVTLADVFARIIRAILGIVGVIALLNFAVAGLGLIWSRGNPESVKKHRDNLTWTLIGIIILFSAYAIIKYAFQAFS